MSDSSAEQNDPKIIIDEDWKSKVEAEREALDAAAEVQAEQQQTNFADASDQETTSEAESPTGSVPLPPPADFSTIVSIFATQAMAAMGLVPGPDGKEPPKQLPVAKHLIDILGVLEEKTKHNLTDREASMLDSSLHQLRMVYLEVLKSIDQSSNG